MTPRRFDDVNAELSAAAQASANNNANAGVEAMASGKQVSRAQMEGMMTAVVTAAVYASAGGPEAAALAAAFATALFGAAETMWVVMGWLGWQASAGPGRCATDPPPKDENDPRWLHFSDLHPTTEWPAPQNSYEIFIRQAMMRYEELRSNCRPAPITFNQMIAGLTAIWNQTHDGPGLAYQPHPEWCRDNGFGGSICDDPLLFHTDGVIVANMGQSNGNAQPPCTQFGFPCQPGPVVVTPEKPTSTATKVATGAAVIGGAGLVTAVAVSWATGKSLNWVFEKAWQGLKGAFR